MYVDILRGRKSDDSVIGYICSALLCRLIDKPACNQGAVQETRKNDVCIPRLLYVLSIRHTCVEILKCVAGATYAPI